MKKTIRIETENRAYVYESEDVPSKGDFVKLLQANGEIYVKKVTHFPELAKVEIVGTFEKPTAKPKK